jgi:transcriptional regulator with XRE-family HTH domain
MEKHDIGSSIRKERLKHQLTLEQLSKSTGLSKSLLSQVERNLTQPSITSIKKIARYFGISVVKLLAGSENGQNLWGYAPSPQAQTMPPLPYARDIQVVRSDRRKGITLPGSNLLYEVLTPDLRRQLEVMFMKIKKGDSSGDQPMLDPPGEKFGIVLRGSIEVRAGEQVYTLHAGDSICHPADVPHSWRGLEGEVIEVIWVHTPPSF